MARTRQKTESSPRDPAYYDRVKLRNLQRLLVKVTDMKRAEKLQAEIAILTERVAVVDRQKAAQEMLAQAEQTAAAPILVPPVSQPDIAILDTRLVGQGADGSRLVWELVQQSDEEKPLWKSRVIGANGQTQSSPVWAPLPGSQYLFLQCPIFETLLEGERGGGKTLLLLMDFAKDVGRGWGKNWRGILFRRHFGDLDDVVMKIETWMQKMFKGFRFLRSKSEYMAQWATGETLLLRHMQDENDYPEYHGHQYCVTTDTKVRMADGTLKLAGQIHVGDSVVTLEGPKPVTWVAPRRVQSCVRVTVYDSSGRLLGVQTQSVDHEILTNVSTRPTQLDAGFANGERMRKHLLRETWRPLLFCERRESLVGDVLKTDDQNVDTWFAWKFQDVLPLLPGRNVRVPVALVPQSLDNQESISSQSPVLGKFLTPSLEITQLVSNLPMDQSQRRALAQLPTGLDFFVSADGVVRARFVTRTTLDSLLGCLSNHDFCDVHVPFSLGDDLIFSPLLNGVALSILGEMRKDDTGSIHEYTPDCVSAYTHPYTQEQRPLGVDTESGFAIFEPCDPHETVDFSVADVGHYITEVGLINKNCWIGWEELTQWATDKAYRLMFSCCRPTAPGVTCRIRATTNPWGPGKPWIKRRFQLPTMRGRVIREPEQRERVALHSRLDENFLMLHDDPQYRLNIMQAATNEGQKKAWTYGDWDAAANGMFDDVWDQGRHIIPNLAADQIPLGWTLTRSYDHGQSAPFSVLWWAESNGEPIRLKQVDGSERIIGEMRGDLVLVWEWYGTTGDENTGLRMAARDIGRGIAEKEMFWGVREKTRSGEPSKKRMRVLPGPADNMIFDSNADRDGHSLADDFADEGVLWVRSDKSAGSRKRGWEAIRGLLKGAAPKDEKGNPLLREKPGLFVCARCTHWINLVPDTPRADDDPDEVPDGIEDHAQDATRYRVTWKVMGMTRSSFGR